MRDELEALDRTLPRNTAVEILPTLLLDSRVVACEAVVY
jgi:hypothetical protein